MVTEKQLAANRKNALKSTGPKTQAGKAFASKNSLKHGLLAQNVVITEGEGAEDQQAFDDLLADFIVQFNPVGSLEEMLVEKIAVCYWRMGRAHRFEVGVLRSELDTITDNYYNSYGTKTDEQIDNEIAEYLEKIEALKSNRKTLKRFYKQGKALSAIDDWEENWKEISYHLPESGEQGQTQAFTIKCIPYKDDKDSLEPEPPSNPIRNQFSEEGFSDEKIWQLHIQDCQDRIDIYQKSIESLQNEKITHKLRLSAHKQIAALPDRHEMDKLLRYETAIERQLYKAISQLERCQRQRMGDYVPAPVQVDLNIDGLKTGT